jgi:hypothetical protein
VKRKAARKPANKPAATPKRLISRENQTWVPIFYPVIASHLEQTLGIRMDPFEALCFAHGVSWGNEVFKKIDPRVAKALLRLAEQEDHVESFLAEGRAAKAVIDARRAALICELYKSVRSSFPAGRKGNGEANRRVAERYEMQTGEAVTDRTVRDTVKKAGLSDPPRRQRKD